MNNNNIDNIINKHLKKIYRRETLVIIIVYIIGYIVLSIFNYL